MRCLTLVGLFVVIFVITFGVVIGGMVLIGQDMPQF
jgi:hypothetical protein